MRPELDLVAAMQNSSLSGDLNPRARRSLRVFLAPLGDMERRSDRSSSELSDLWRRCAIDAAAAKPCGAGGRDPDELQLRQAEVRRRQLENQIRLEVADAQVAMQAARRPMKRQCRRASCRKSPSAWNSRSSMRAFPPIIW